MNNESTTVAEEALDELRDRFLTFYIEDTFYSIELCHIIEIISIQLTTYVPGLPEYFKGIINHCYHSRYAGGPDRGPGCRGGKHRN